ASTTKHLTAVTDRTGAKKVKKTFAGVRDAAAFNRITDYVRKWQLPANAKTSTPPSTNRITRHQDQLMLERMNFLPQRHWPAAAAFLNSLQLDPIPQVPSVELACTTTLFFC